MQIAAAYLTTEVALPLTSSEMGQQDQGAATVTARMGKSLDLKLAYVISFSIAPNEKAIANLAGRISTYSRTYKTISRQFKATKEDSQ